jgi:hypothetical protein
LPGRWASAHVIDWGAFAAAHDDFFYPDGFHLRPAGQLVYSSLIAGEIGPLPLTPVTAAPKPHSALPVVAVAAPDELAPVPLAVAGGKVWVAHAVHASGNHVLLEGHDPATGRLLTTIDVPQEGLFGIAGDGNTLWVAGGGDGGIPDTTVSRVDVGTGRVAFTHTIKGTPCSCPIVAGSAGVWVVGNSSEYALHLSSTDGHVLANVPLGARALLHGAAEIGGRLVVGLDDGSIAVIDPARNRVERSIPRPVCCDPPAAQVLALSTAAVPAIGSDPPIDGFATRVRGEVDAFMSGLGSADEFTSVNDFVPSAVAAVGTRAAILGSDHLVVSTTHAMSSAEFVYDSTSRTFARASGTSFSSAPGFTDVVAVGDTLWAVYDPGSPVPPSLVVVRIPASVP